MGQWESKLQTKIGLSSTDSEYVALSQSLREVIPIMELISELQQAGLNFNKNTPIMGGKVFEDNNGALEMAMHKMRRCSKHINIKYHHVREAVRDGRIKLEKIHITEQQVDTLTKPLEENTFQHIQKLLIG
jgi:hypothetical protein